MSHSHVRLSAALVQTVQRTGKLDLHDRSLFDIPTDVFAAEVAPFLTSLDLSDNKLRVLPGDVSQLSSLRELFLEGNQLTSLPQELLLLPHLKAIALEGNQGLDPELKQV